jgi:Fe-S-cluster containining protein
MASFNQKPTFLKIDDTSTSGESISLFPISDQNYNNPNQHKIDPAMVKFNCNGCGKCCVSIGDFIKLERKVTSHDYFCRYGITNELFHVHVDPDYANEFADKFEEMENNGKNAALKGCVFMHRKREGSGFLCIIYPDRPTICREFLCYRMLIKDRKTGECRGKVVGINELITRDPTLESIWKEKIAHLPHQFDSEHQKMTHTHAPGAERSHGHDHHMLAHIYGLDHPDDKEWMANVMTELAAHGYQGDPVE